MKSRKRDEKNQKYRIGRWKCVSVQFFDSQLSTIQIKIFQNPTRKESQNKQAYNPNYVAAHLTPEQKSGSLITIIFKICDIWNGNQIDQKLQNDTNSKFILNLNLIYTSNGVIANAKNLVCCVCVLNNRIIVCLAYSGDKKCARCAFLRSLSKTYKSFYVICLFSAFSFITVGRLGWFAII